MIVVTGSAGFIGSNLVAKLNSEGFKDIILVDDFTYKQKNANYETKTYTDKIDRRSFFEWAEQNQKFIQFIFHLGARTDTTEFDKRVFDDLNLDYSKKVWKLCVKHAKIYCDNPRCIEGNHHKDCPLNEEVIKARDDMLIRDGVLDE